jgi:hypothetical protein
MSFGVRLLRAVLGREEWKNPTATVPLASGPVRVEYLDQSFSGRLLNVSIKFRCAGAVLELPCSKIRLIRTDRRLFGRPRSRLFIVLIDGSEFRHAEFHPGTVLQFSTTIGRRAIEPKFRNRWNPLGSRGYDPLQIVGVGNDDPRR